MQRHRSDGFNLDLVVAIGLVLVCVFVLPLESPRRQLGKRLSHPVRHEPADFDGSDQKRPRPLLPDTLVTTIRREVDGLVVVRSNNFGRDGRVTEGYDGEAVLDGRNVENIN